VKPVMEAHGLEDGEKKKCYFEKKKIAANLYAIKLSRISLSPPSLS
jgi:hypothetical protein